MADSFLGKPYPNLEPVSAPPKKSQLPPWLFIGVSGIGLIVATFATLTAGLPVLSRQLSFVEPTPTDTVSVRVFGQAAAGGGDIINGGANGGSTGGGSNSTVTNPVFTNPCDLLLDSYNAPNSKDDGKRFSSSRIFPIITSDILSDDPKGCSPPYWNIRIFTILLYKALGLLNYIALTLAILFTVLAGVLYISGTFNEKNVAKAKTILISTYIGLIITLSARLILGSTQLIIGATTTDTINTTIQNNLNPNP